MKNNRSQKNIYSSQVDKSHYNFETYLNLERWISYYHQIQNIRFVSDLLKQKSFNVLEIGIGDKTVSNILKNIGFKIITADIDPKLKPDHIISLPIIDLNRKFDCIVCCEVLEHLKYQDAEKSLKSMSKLSRYCVLSLPHKSISISITLKIWFLKTFKLYISTPSPKSFIKFQFNGEHYWEIGAKGFSLKRLKKSIKNSGFRIIKDYRVPEYPYHHFFLLRSLANEK